MDVPSSDARPIRSFIAIEVGDAVRAEITAFLVRLRDHIADVAWTPPQNLHLTLKFLGSVSPDCIGPLVERLRVIAATEPVFDVTFRGVGTFPSATHPRVLWVGAAASALARLAVAVDVASAAAGVAPEVRPYHPHVTLGRVRTPRRGARPSRTEAGRTVGVLERERDRVFGVAAATEIVLFRSDLGPKGASHTPLARLPFPDRY